MQMKQTKDAVRVIPEQTVATDRVRQPIEADGSADPELLRSEVARCMMLNAAAIAAGVVYVLFVHILMKGGSGSISLGYEIYLFLIGASITRDSRWGYRKFKKNIIFIGVFGAIAGAMVFTGFALFRNEFYSSILPFGVISSAIAVFNLSLAVRYRKVDFKILGSDIKGWRKFPPYAIVLSVCYGSLVAYGVYRMFAAPFPPIGGLG